MKKTDISNREVPIRLHTLGKTLCWLKVFICASLSILISLLSNTAFAADWWNTSWSKCREITVANTGTSTLSNFPAYISLAYDADMQADYDDIRFIDTTCDNNGSELDFEIESYSGASADVWVEIDSLPVAGKTIAVYYGNVSAGAGEDVNGSWDSNHQGVWHLGENTDASNQDSTSNSNNGTPSRSPASDVGKIGSALDFSSSDRTNVAVGTDASLNLNSYSDWTISMWVKPANNFTSRKYPVMYVYGDYHASVGLAKQEGPADGLIENYRNDSSGIYSDTSLTAGVWSHVAVVRTAATTYFYLNGVADGTDSSVTINQDNSGSYIGGYPGYRNGDLRGVIDEVRVSNVLRSADWIKQSYQLVENQGTYVSTGAEVEQVVGPTLTGSLNVDNTFIAYISTDDAVQGTLIGSGNDWPTTVDIVASLTAGQDYYLHIYATDVGGVAGFLGDFELTGAEHTFSNGLTALTTNTSNWFVSTTGWSNYLAASGYGVNGVSPWGTIAGVDSNAVWIWSSDSSGDNVNYFSTKISAPSASIDDVTVLASNSVDFTVTLEQAAASDVVVSYSTSDSTAVAGVDYTAATGSITILTGQTTGTISINSLNGNQGGDVQFQLAITSSDANISDATGVGTITPISCGAGSAANVSELSDFTQIYQLDIPSNENYDSSTPAYGVDNSATPIASGIDRIGYYLELQETGSCATEWVWVSMDAFTQDLGETGVPVISTGATWQQLVDNINVESNVAGVVTGTAITTGNIEFWHHCYGVSNAASVSGASSSTYDFGDSFGANSCYGSMQVHNYGAAQTLFAWNAWDWAAGDDIGIGNRPSSHPDWTFANNTSDYSLKNMEVWVRPANLAPVLEYRFDEASWNGTTDEVVDNVSTGIDGTAVGDTTTIAAGQVCRTGTFDGTGDYIDVTGIDSYLNTTASLSFWIKTGQSGNNSAWNAPGIIGVEQSGGGDDIFWGYLDASGHIRIQKGNGSSASSSNPINDDNWHHVVLTWDSVSGAVQTFVDGNLDDSANSETGDVGRSFSSIGRIDSGYSSLNFIGQLDEVLVFNSVISASDVSTIYTNQLNGDNYDASARVCPVASVPDHYAISHNSPGVTCEGAQITVTAHDASHAAFTVSSDTALTVTTTPSVDAIVSSPATILSGASSTTFYLHESDAADTPNIDIDVTDGTATDPDDAGSEDSVFNFVDTAFQFYVDGVPTDDIGVQIAGKSSADTPGEQTLTLKAIRTDDDTGECEAALQNITTSVGIAYECNNPTTCTGSNLLSVVADSTATVSRNDNNTTPLSYTDVDMAFDINGFAPFTFNYSDAGQVTLHAQKTVDASLPNPAFTLSGSSNAFVTRPFGFYLDFADPNAYAADFSESVFAVAGNNFSMNIKAVLWDEDEDDTPNDGIPDSDADLSNNAIANNFGEGIEDSSVTTLVINHSKVAPTGLGTEPGTLTASTVTVGGSSTSFTESGGVFSATATLSWDEVGIIDITAELANYLEDSSADITTTAANVGRFYPDHFLVTASSGTLADSCSGSFSYIGQAIAYGTAPSATIVARNSANSPTSNYTHSDYLNLAPVNISRTFSNADNTTQNSDSSALMAVVSDMISGSGAIVTTGNAGELLYTFDALDTFTYTKNDKSEVAPFTSSLTITGSLVDADLVAALENPSWTPTSTTDSILYGRWVLDNAYGPETDALKIPMRAEYYDGSTYITNLDDSCSTFNSTDLVDNDSNLSDSGTTSASGSGTASSGVALVAQQIQMIAPGAGKQGIVDLCLDVEEWLKYDWNGDGINLSQTCATPPTVTQGDNPRSTATFGQYRGSDRIIYWREVNN